MANIEGAQLCLVSVDASVKSLRSTLISKRLVLLPRRLILLPQNSWGFIFTLQTWYFQKRDVTLS